MCNTSAKCVIQCKLCIEILDYDWLMNNRVWSGPMKSFVFKSSARPGWRNFFLRAGSHFDISISISINISITKICVNRDYISITVRMAIVPAQFTSRESKMADYELEIGLLFLLSRRNRRRLLMQRQTQRKPRKV